MSEHSHAARAVSVSYSGWPVCLPCVRTARGTYRPSRVWNIEESADQCRERPQRGHKRFIGGTILCPRMSRRCNLGLDHRIHDEFVCPRLRRPRPGEGDRVTAASASQLMVAALYVAKDGDVRRRTWS